MNILPLKPSRSYPYIPSKSQHSLATTMESSSGPSNHAVDMTGARKASTGSGKGKAAAVAVTTRAGWRKGVAIFDFVLRLSAIGAAIGATATMGTTDETLPFFTQFFQFQAEYDDFQVFMFFVIAMGIVSAYLVLSLPFSVVGIVRPFAAGPKLLLLIVDTVMMALAIGAAAAAASIVYLAHNGNPSANWLPICQQFGDFCQGTSAAVVAALIAATLLLILIVLSAFAIRRRA